MLTTSISLVYSSQRENLNTFIVSEKLESQDKLVDHAANMTINGVGYELNIASASAAQVEFVSDPEKVTHTRNCDTHQKLSSSQTIRTCHKDILVLEPTTDPKNWVNNQPAFLISTGLVLVPQTLQLPTTKEIVVEKASDKTVAKRTS